MNRRLLAITPVDHPGGAETTLMRLLAGWHGRGWTIMVTTPGRRPLRTQAIRAGYEWHALGLGGLKRGAGARAVGSWAKVRRLARRVDVVYLSGAICRQLQEEMVRAARAHAHRFRVDDYIEPVEGLIE